jgi:hypothetical protein
MVVYQTPGPRSASALPPWDQPINSSRHMRNLLFAIVAGIWATCAGLAAATEFPKNDTQSRIRPTFVVIPADWPSQIPPTGMVNAPTFLNTLYPERRFSVGFLVEGRDRDRVLAGAILAVKICVAGHLVHEEQAVMPSVIRKIKAEGGDFALLALSAAGLKTEERIKAEEALSLQSLVVFPVAWAPPSSEGLTQLEISVDLSGAPARPAIEPHTFAVKGSDEWLKESPPTQEQFGKFLNRYHENLSPGQVINLLRTVANTPALKAYSIRGFFATKFRVQVDCRDAAVRVYPQLDTGTQQAVLWTLRLAGQDLGKLFPNLSSETLAEYEKTEPLGNLSALPHFSDPVTPEEVMNVGNQMDLSWAGWMATGDPVYLRALVDLLAGAPDFEALKKWQQSRGGAKGLTASVARGLAYQIAGWSLASFQRTDPHVADWLAYWQNDETVSATVRKEIATLPTNPAFKRK